MDEDTRVMADQDTAHDSEHGRDHDHEHDHVHQDEHGHEHDHVHARPISGRHLALSLTVTAVVFLAELIGGTYTHSLALVSDAWHVLTDLLALALASMAFRQATRPATGEHTFGFHRTEVLVALVNGVSLLVITGGIFYEAFGRLQHPEPIRGGEMFIIATIGLVANLVVAGLLGHSHDESLIVRSAMLHVIGDALSSVAVIIGGVLITWFGWYVADPLISFGIGLMILRSALQVTLEAVHILMEGRPQGVDINAMVTRLKKVAGATDVHDLHVWNVSSQIRAATLHVLVTPEADPQAVLDQFQEVLRKEFGIAHPVVQVERCCEMAGSALCDLQA